MQQTKGGIGRTKEKFFNGLEVSGGVLTKETIVQANEINGKLKEIKLGETQSSSDIITETYCVLWKSAIKSKNLHYVIIVH